MDRQGLPDRNVRTGGKREPVAFNKSPAGVSQIGEAVDPKAVEAMHKGRGFMAPRDRKVETYPSGSQSCDYK